MDKKCDDWQRPIFLALAVYGVRVGELTHLLVKDVDFNEDVIWIRSKPELLWYLSPSALIAAMSRGLYIRFRGSAPHG